MVASLTIRVSAPAPAAPAATPVAPWVCVLQAPGQPDHLLSLSCQEPASTFTLDETSVPALAADLLRAGWASLAEAREPVMVSDQLYRGFVLDRLATLGAAAGETWRLEALTAVGLEHPWDWPATHRLLDAFAALIRGVEPSHD